MKFQNFRGAAPDPAGGGGGGLTAPPPLPDPQLEKGRATHGLSCFARLAIVLLFKFFVLRPDQFLFRCFSLLRPCHEAFVLLQPFLIKISKSDFDELFWVLHL